MYFFVSATCREVAVDKLERSKTCEVVQREVATCLDVIRLIISRDGFRSVKFKKLL